MKIAGRKNDGAWFRTNDAISRLETEEERANLAGSIANSLYIDAAYNALADIIAKTGIADIPHAADIEEWATSFAWDGIPRQIWNGNLSWAPYTKVAGGLLTGGRYIKDGEAALRYFATDLRKICKTYFLARRLVRDVFNAGTRAEGNVGGLPDASKLT